MSRLRHKERAEGGRLSSEPKWNAGGEQNAAKEAEEKKRGGRVHHSAEGEEAKKRGDRKERARGGGVKAFKHGGHAKHEMNPEELKHGGHAHKKEHEHKGRARGGRIGADRMPLSSAAKVKHVTKGEEPEEGGPDGKTVPNP
jgi:hypothetical protein